MKKILLSIILFGSLSAFTAYNGISNESITTNDANVRAYMVIDTGGPNAYFYTIPCAQVFVDNHPGSSIYAPAPNYTPVKVTVDESLVFICL